MNIIEQGSLPEDKPIRKSCYKCKTKFEYTKRDVKYDRDGQYIICPFCGAYIDAGTPKYVDRMDD